MKMKLLSSILLLFLFAWYVLAQTVPNPPDKPRVTVIEKKWRVEVYNPALDKDPFQANKDRQKEEIAQRRDARENENRIRQGEPALPPRVRVPASETEGRRLSVTYVYEVKVRNTSDKVIRTLVWEYVFFEPGTIREVGRRRFISTVNIGRGRTATLVKRAASSPTGTFDATKAGKKPQDQYSEQVIIKSVGYADGSAWQPAPN